MLYLLHTNAHTYAYTHGSTWYLCGSWNYLHKFFFISLNFQLNVRNKSAAGECYVRTEVCLEGFDRLIMLYFWYYLELHTPLKLMDFWFCKVLNFFKTFSLEHRLIKQQLFYYPNIWLLGGNIMWIHITGIWSISHFFSFLDASKTLVLREIITTTLDWHIFLHVYFCWGWGD